MHIRYRVGIPEKHNRKLESGKEVVLNVEVDVVKWKV
jgi:hypothetical protein